MSNSVDFISTLANVLWLHSLSLVLVPFASSTQTRGPLLRGTRLAPASGSAAWRELWSLQVPAHCLQPQLNSGGRHLGDWKLTGSGPASLGVEHTESFLSGVPTRWWDGKSNREFRTKQRLRKEKFFNLVALKPKLTAKSLTSVALACMVLCTFSVSRQLWELEVDFSLDIRKQSYFFAQLSLAEKSHMLRLQNFLEFKTKINENIMGKKVKHVFLCFFFFFERGRKSDFAVACDSINSCVFGFNLFCSSVDWGSLFWLLVQFTPLEIHLPFEKPNMLPNSECRMVPCAPQNFLCHLRQHMRYPGVLSDFLSEALSVWTRGLRRAQSPFSPWGGLTSCG